MRANWVGNDALQKRVLRHDREARVIVEAVAVEKEDIKNTKAEFLACDSNTGFQFLDDGGVRLTGDTTTLLDHSGDSSSDSGDATILHSDMWPSSSIVAQEIDWAGANAHDIEIYSVEVRLDRNTDGGSTNVSKWNCQLFQLATDNDGALPSASPTLSPITGVVSTAPGGDATEDVTFTFADASSGVIPKVGKRPTGTGQTTPVTVVFIWGTQASGAFATNCHWMADDSASSKVVDGHTIKAYTYTRPDDAKGAPAGGQWDRGASVAKLGRMKFIYRDYDDNVAVVFSGGNKPDLGGTPTGTVEFIGQGDLPSDSTITFQVKNDADDAWVTFTDGQTSDDLSGVGKNQTYKMQATLTANSTDTAGPTLRMLGVREVSITDLDGLATVQGMESVVDPVFNRGEISNPTITLIRDGNQDYRDVATDLLATHHIAKLDFRVWLGHPDLTKYKDWLLLNTYQVEDIAFGSGSVHFSCVSPLHHLGATIPPYNTSTDKRLPKVYTNATVTAVWEDLVDSQLSVPGRFRGTPPQDSGTITKTLRESRGKDEVDAVSFLADWATIDSQGKIKAVDMSGQPAAVAEIPMEEVTTGTLTPGYRHRIEEFFVPYNFSEGVGEFLNEHRAFNALSIVNFGSTYVDPPDVLKDTTAKWLSSSTMAIQVGSRMVNRLGAGLAVWSIHTTYPNPHLEPGDTVKIQTDKFVAANPVESTIQPLRGMWWANGVVTAVRGPWGQDLDVWITHPFLGNIADEATQGDRSGLGEAPAILGATVVFNTSGNPVLSIHTNGATKSIRADVTNNGSRSAADTLTAVRGNTVATTSGNQALNYAHGNGFEDTVYTVGQTAYIHVIGFAAAAGTLASAGGVESEVHSFSVVRPDDNTSRYSFSDKLIMTNVSPSGTPSSGTTWLYTKASDKRLYYETDDGTVYGPLAAADE